VVVCTLYNVLVPLMASACRATALGARVALVPGVATVPAGNGRPNVAHPLLAVKPIASPSSVVRQQGANTTLKRIFCMASVNGMVQTALCRIRDMC